MLLEIVRGDLTAMKVDAIVNAANESLLGGGGVDGAIHRAAGPELLRECRTLGGCRTGQAKVTKGYSLPARAVIHTVGPVWRGGRYGERELLVSAYRSSLELAERHGFRTVAFPLISSGAYGYPKDQALKVAVDTIGAFLMEHELNVSLVVFDRAAYSIGQALTADIAAWLGRREAAGCPGGERDGREGSFSRVLLEKIRGRGMTDAQACKRANIDRERFPQICSAPSKPEALALAVALELTPGEARALLEAAGFAFSRADRTDGIVEYFIARNHYNVFEINAALFAFDQSLLGG